MAELVWDCLPAYFVGAAGVGGIIAASLASKPETPVRIAIIWTIAIFTALIIAICLVLWIPRADKVTFFNGSSMWMNIDYRAWSWVISIISIILIGVFVWWQAFFIASKASSE